MLFRSGAILADNILVMEHITKEFPGVKALDNVNLEVQRGEIHALIGENGAGKSTLMNVLSGQYPYGSYTGTVTYEGEECKFKKLNDSEAKGIVIIHQELALIPLLSIGENMFLGNEIKNKRGAIDWDKTYSEGEKAAGNVRDISKGRYARKLKKKAKMQGKKGARTAKSSAQKPTAAQDAGASGTGEGGSNWLSRWRQKQDIRQRSEERRVGKECRSRWSPYH